MEGRRALVTEVQALVGASGGRLTPAHGQRPRQRPARHGAGRAAEPVRAEAARTGDLRRHRRRNPRGRASRRPRRSPSRSPPRPTTYRSRPIWSRSARWASPARSAGSGRWPDGWPRQRGWASGTRWSRPGAVPRDRMAFPAGCGWSRCRTCGPRCSGRRSIRPRHPARIEGSTTNAGRARDRLPEIGPTGANP